MKEHTKYILERKSFFGKAAVFCLLLAAAFRTAAALMNRAVFAEPFTTLETLLPICSCLLYVLFIFLFGRKGFFFTVIPFVLGALGMIMRLFSYDSLMQEQATQFHAFSAVLLCLILTAFYSATVFGGIRTKWLLPPLFAFALMFHLVAEVYPVIREGYKIAFPLMVAEAGLDLIFLGMFFSSLTMKKRTRPAGGLFRRNKKEKVTASAPVQSVLSVPEAAATAAEAHPAAPVQEVTTEEEISERAQTAETVPPPAAEEAASPAEAPEEEGDSTV